MSTFFMDLEFLCDEHFVYEDDIIAICLLAEDDSYELTKYIRPYDDTFEISTYCTALTGITHEMLETQPFFDEVYEEIIENTSADDVIYVWGNVDLEAIYKASIAIAGELELGIVDFQDEFVQFCGLSFRPSLKKVYEALTDDAEMKHHDVRSDTLMLKEIYRIFNLDKKAAMRTVKGKLR